MPRIKPYIELKSPRDPVVQEFLESCEQGNLSLVQEQIQHRRSSDGSLTHGLNKAAKGDYVETMRYLVQNGATIDSVTVGQTRSPAGFQVLIDHGFTVHDDMYGEVPLMSVLEKRDEELLLWFLAQGADPNFGPADASHEMYHDPPVENSGMALQVAAQCCTTEIVDILLEHGARMENSLPLHRALIRAAPYRFTMMEHLVRCGADVNKLGYAHAMPRTGTPLHVAANYGDVTDVKWLVDHGACITLSNSMGGWPAAEAELNENEEVRQYLLDLREKEKST